ncbi:Exocyst complex component SEC15A [Camellia lanceoleosa]|uniref:Exocyst complex component SEC15A n=1 Tax=Camellia lanceoleosa TaxID=1840588 RepID=A0ACC0IBX2_9ERIC|nr:Exocyst complex component SEC15A [Camellia lanceoleosa]
MASGSCVGRNRKRSASASWSRPDGDTSTRKAPKRQSRLPYKKQRVSVNVGKNADAADSSKAMYRSNISGVIKTVLELDFGERHIRKIRKTPFAAMVDAIRAHNLIPQSFKKCDATVCRIIKTYNLEDEKFHIGGAKLPLRNNDIRLIFGLQCGKTKFGLSKRSKGLRISCKGAGQNVMDVDPVNEGRNVDPSFNCWQKDSADGGDVRKDKNGTPTSKKKALIVRGIHIAYRLIVWDGGESGIQVHITDIKDLVQENSIHGNVIDAYGAMLTDMHRTVSGRREYQGTAYVYSSVCAFFLDVAIWYIISLVNSGLTGLIGTMNAKPKRRTVKENGDTGEDLVLATLIGNGEDLGPMVKHAFEMGRPEALLHQLKFVVKKKEVEIEELCKLHYEEFILAVDELQVS